MRRPAPGVLRAAPAIGAGAAPDASLSNRWPGEGAERLNAPVSKTGMGGSVHRGFESLPLRSPAIGGPPAPRNPRSQHPLMLRELLRRRDDNRPRGRNRR